MNLYFLVITDSYNNLFKLDYSISQIINEPVWDALVVHYEKQGLSSYFRSFVTIGVMGSSQDTPQATHHLFCYMNKAYRSQSWGKIQVKTVDPVGPWLWLSRPRGTRHLWLAGPCIDPRLLYQLHTFFDCIRQVVYYTDCWGHLLRRMSMIDYYRLTVSHLMGIAGERPSGSRVCSTIYLFSNCFQLC